MGRLDVGLRFVILFLMGLGLGACSSDQTETKMGTVRLKSRSGSSVEGHVFFHQVGDKIHMAYEVKGLPPKSVHGFHIHEKGDCSAADASSAGGHFNPTGKMHGDPATMNHHAGDLGNITADEKGLAKGEGMISAAVTVSKLQGLSVIVHDQADDEKTQPSGNSGSRIACGIIE